MEKFISFLNFFAPLYFLIISGVRCYLESRIFTDYDYFSYYLLSHHVLWFMTSILSVILFLSVYLNKPAKELRWLFYGGSIIFIPVIYAYFNKRPMNLEYFSGTFREVAVYSLTAAYQFTRNRPQFFAILVLDIGIFITGYLYTRSFKKALFTLIGTHFILTVIGTKWFGKSVKTTAVFRIHTRFSGQEFMSLIFLITTTILTMILLLKDNAKWIGYRFLTIILVVSSAVWGMCSMLLFHFKFFKTVFDSFTIGIFPFSVVFAFFLLAKRNTIPFSNFIFAGLLLMLIVQMYVLLPIIKSIL